MRGNCWLIADSDGGYPAAITPFARLRKLAVRFHPGGSHAITAQGKRDLIAARLDTAKRLDRDAADALRRSVESGATLYLRGGFGSDVTESLRPVADFSFSVSAPFHAEAMTFTSHRMIPQAAENEAVKVDFAAAAAGLPDSRAEPLVMLRESGGSPRPAVFALRAGAGMIICDLARETPPQGCAAGSLDIAAGLGPLLAANRAADVEPKFPAAFNIVVDDRPINYDYFSILRLARLLEHVTGRMPEVHVDFAWTPSQMRPANGYLALLKRFGAGFVWHGFYQHVDHRSLINPDRLIAQ
ncbi:MAG: hypothetical protein ACREP6_05095, partial [Candidatus Binataceae bacterium]